MEGATAIPGTEGSDHAFIVTSVPVRKLTFEDHQFNPRTPSLGRVNELRASISQLGLLSPLTCAYVAPIEPTKPNKPGKKNDSGEEVVLIDGRHRFDALQALSNEDKKWASRARVDLKIYFGLSKSDIFLLSTYLNRTRKALAKGEYYRVIVHIYEEKKKELEAQDGRPRTEEEVFKEISAQTISDRDFDLSIGRIVGLVAFDEEEDDSWYPMVGNRQQERFRGPPKLPGYCPLTAGNLGAFLAYLCRPKPYSDLGAHRALEIGNVLQLGQVFRKRVIQKPVKSYDVPTGTSVACKHWCLVAFGSILEESQLFASQARASRAPLAVEDPDWAGVDEVVTTYKEIMDEQAEIVRKYKSTEEPGFLADAWSYQTQRDQVKLPLRQAFKDRGVKSLTKAAT